MAQVRLLREVPPDQAVRVLVVSYLTGQSSRDVIMFEDPVVQEVRAARQRHCERFGYDLEAIVASLQEKQQHMDRPVVSLSPKRLRQQAS